LSWRRFLVAQNGGFVHLPSCNLSKFPHDPLIEDAQPAGIQSKRGRLGRAMGCRIASRSFVGLAFVSVVSAPDYHAPPLPPGLCSHVRLQAFCDVIEDLVLLFGGTPMGLRRVAAAMRPGFWRPLAFLGMAPVAGSWMARLLATARARRSVRQHGVPREGQSGRCPVVSPHTQKLAGIILVQLLDAPPRAQV